MAENNEIRLYVTGKDAGTLKRDYKLSTIENQTEIGSEAVLELKFVENQDFKISSKHDQKDCENSVDLMEDDIVITGIEIPDNFSHSDPDLHRRNQETKLDRRSGILPARKRVAPAKFRDYKHSDLEDEAIGEITETKITVINQKALKLIDAADECQNAEVSKNHLETEEKKSSNMGTPSKRGRRSKGEAVAATPKNFQCPMCNRWFSQKGNMKAHMRIHTGERPFRCNIVDCNKAFRSNETLRRHKLAHLGVKLYECEICKQRFSSNVSLKEHVDRHTDSKAYKCETCGRFFRQMSCFKRHLVTHSSETPFECNQCGKKFSQMCYLRSHKRSHTGEKPFTCLDCGKSFSHHSDLNRHKILHKGIKPFCCDVCGARFADPSSRRRHVREHSGFKPYTCQLCHETFKRPNQLKGHFSKKHPNYLQEITLSKEPIKTMEINGEKLAADVDQKALDGQKEFVKKVTQGAMDELRTQIVIHSSDQENGILQLEGAQVLPTNVDTLELVGTVDGQVHHITEETQNIIQQIQSQLDSQAQSLPDGQPLQVAYKIIHDDDNQQVLEIQYHQVLHEADPPQSIVDSEYAEQPNSCFREDLQQILKVVSSNDSSSLQSQQALISQAELVEFDVQEDVEVDEVTQNMDSSHNFAPSTSQQDLQERYEETAYTFTPKLLPATSPMLLAGTDSSNGSVDYVTSPDFSSQEYYNWLSSFTELCKLVPIPLDVDLFQKISQVHKSLTDVLATPSGILTNKQNFQILMNISGDLNIIINSHLAFVLKNLDPGD